MAEDLGEKTEKPTSRKRSQARNQGQIAKSQDLSSTLDLVGAFLILVLMGGMIFHGMRHIMERTMQVDVAQDLVREDALLPLVSWASQRGAMILFPVMLIMALVAAVGQFTQVGLLFTTKPLKPNLNKLNPVSGAKKMFSKRNAVKSMVNTLKLAVVIGVGVLVLYGRVGHLAVLPERETTIALALILRLAAEFAMWLLLVLLILAIIDYIYQRWQHTEDLKMTKHEVKDERRSLEGDPKIKRKRLMMARDIALQRIQSAVPDADVVVTNPTHYAVAIRYDPETMAAPRVVAKGADLLAMRVRQIAAMHKVPIVERPPLARALYYGVEVGQSVRPEHYEAVAEILAYVYRLEERSSAA